LSTPTRQSMSTPTVHFAWSVTVQFHCPLYTRLTLSTVHCPPPPTVHSDWSVTAQFHCPLYTRLTLSTVHSPLSTVIGQSLSTPTVHFVWSVTVQFHCPLYTRLTLSTVHPHCPLRLVTYWSVATTDDQSDGQYKRRHE